MSVSFDPYHKWLGIPPKDQPPHHYRLLGIELFEDDVDVIDSAANRLMAYLHDVASGDSTGQSQKLLNEISAARICLLHKQRKSEYDSQLKATLRTDTARGRDRISPLPEAPTTSETPSGEEFASARKSPHRRWLVGLAAALGLGALGTAAVLIGIGPWRTGGDDTAVRETRQQRGDTVTVSKPQQHTSLVLDWPVTQRDATTLVVNGAERKIPMNGEIALPLDAGPLELRITRAGYVDILWTCVVARGEKVRYSPVWEPKEGSTIAAQQTKGPARQRGMAGDGSSNPALPATPVNSTPANDREGTQTDASPPKDPTAEMAVEFPAHLAIPPRTTTDESGTSELLRLPPQLPVELRLVGGESLLSSGAFQLTPRRDGDRQAWIVHQVDRKEQRTEIAELVLSSGNVEFRWLPDSEFRQADQLRNALLEVSIGKQKALLPLRQAVSAPPLDLAGEKGAGQIDVRIDTLPEISRLRLELTRSTGTPSFAKKLDRRVTGPQQPIMVDLGAGESEYPLMVHLSFEASRAGARIVHIRYRLGYRSYNPQLANWSRRNITQNLVSAKSTRQNSSVANQKQLDHLARNIDYFTQLESLAHGETPLYLHYRLLFVTEGHEVILATTE